MSKMNFNYEIFMLVCYKAHNYLYDKDMMKELDIDDEKLKSDTCNYVIENFKKMQTLEPKLLDSDLSSFEQVKTFIGDFTFEDFSKMLLDFSEFEKQSF